MFSPSIRPAPKYIVLADRGAVERIHPMLDGADVNSVERGLSPCASLRFSGD